MNYLKSHRLWFFFLLPVVLLAWNFATDPDGGAETLVRVQWWSWILIGSGPVYLIRRALIGDQGTRAGDAYREAIKHPVGAGLAFLGFCVLTGLLFLGVAGQAKAATLPPGAVAYLPTLGGEIAAHWPDVPLRSSLAAQVEQETCPGLASRKCWNPRAELKTDREYGFGLGQLTVTARFDNFKTARGLDRSLKGWAWADRYDPARQLRAMILMDRSGFVSLSRFAPDARERLAMAFSAYNGGLGGVLADRRVCGQVPGCDPARWFGHVERHSLKAKVAAHGYGQSFFQINRGYVRAVMVDRRPRYAGYFGEV